MYKAMSNLRQNLPYTSLDQEICSLIHGGCGLIDQYQFVPSVIIDQPGCRIYRKRSPSYYKYVCLADIIHRLAHGIHIQALFVEDDVRLDTAAALIALRNSFRIDNIVHVEEFMTLLAVVSKNAAVKLQYLLRARRLVQSVDILGNNRLKLPRLFPLG